ncbi:hypothetical protein B0H66DRAFT_527919 [Apodospora peruviana]|uniref:Uncharacterized protein n=1 Tax=Apodospora peruviana TaxID=516989 RepID=A0AAE0MFE4_9PEZI|nr:hypothetical protein B0H66DRAFT_527919 [Apodospora peruviana]
MSVVIMRSPTSHASLSTLLLLATAVTASKATIAAWWTGIGPQVMFQNETTGAFHYTACSSKNGPQYDPASNNTLDLDYKPRMSTPLAGAGYLTKQNTFVVLTDMSTASASIYYLDEFNNIINGVFNCNMTTGVFTRQGNWIISNVAPSVSPNSGLAALMLGPTAGYRIYFHDDDMAVNELKYTVDDGWSYTGIISPDAQLSSAIHAAFTGTNNITVVTARDDQNMEVTRFHSDSTWHITTLPHPLEGEVATNGTNPSVIAINATAQSNFTLAEWTGRPGAVGISIDSKHTRALWYIGNDSRLYSVSSSDSAWRPEPKQSPTLWPLADSPNANLAVTSDYLNSNVRIYYMVKGQLAEIKFDTGVWKDWSVLPLPNITTLPPSDDSSITGLSQAAKLGLGVGIALGIIAIGALGAALFLLRRKKGVAPADKTISGSSTPTHSPSTNYSSTAPSSGSAGYDHYMSEKGSRYPTANTAGLHQLDSVNHPTEMLASEPVYELPEQSYSHELMADEHIRQQGPPPAV